LGLTFAALFVDFIVHLMFLFVDVKRRGENQSKGEACRDATSNAHNGSRLHPPVLLSGQLLNSNKSSILIG